MKTEGLRIVLNTADMERLRLGRVAEFNGISIVYAKDVSAAVEYAAKEFLQCLSERGNAIPEGSIPWNLFQKLKGAILDNRVEDDD